MKRTSKLALVVLMAGTTMVASAQTWNEAQGNAVAVSQPADGGFLRVSDNGQYHPDPRYDDGQYHPKRRYDDGQYHPDRRYDDGQYHPKRRYDDGQYHEGR
ncbi:hypothetical protein [Jeongeupia naejangsanensis]|uniref:Uncharacterized protein n=1 Tax=Jeongeupia naejangsanensis TaxID=613195 RepID=A0ABS2BN80_9NEIS|nr:hypothetical protein [Jeongeupia naejangsanensis]MBM3117069.1 hypothetical protein [Jeongeupia naejangsanensis]